MRLIPVSVDGLLPINEVRCRVLHGALDDRTMPALCREFFGLWKKSRVGGSRSRTADPQTSVGVGRSSVRPMPPARRVEARCCVSPDEMYKESEGVGLDEEDLATAIATSNPTGLSDCGRSP
jgi:hypothetical protein